MIMIKITNSINKQNVDKTVINSKFHYNTNVANNGAFQ